MIKKLLENHTDVANISRTKLIFWNSSFKGHIGVYSIWKCHLYISCSVLDCMQVRGDYQGKTHWAFEAMNVSHISLFYSFLSFLLIPSIDIGEANLPAPWFSLIYVVLDIDVYLLHSCALTWLCSRKQILGSHSLSNNYSY